MTQAQAGIFQHDAAHHHYLEYSVTDTANLAPALSAALTAPRAPGQSVVVAFGPAVWTHVSPDAPSAGLRPFEPLGDPAGAHAPATQRDIWIWIQGPGQDLNFDLALALQGQLGAVAELDLEVSGFAYHGDRDLIGFVDGTGNPKTPDAQEDAALIPGTGGGSFLLTQKWVHDLPAFNALDVAEQEAVVGRTKVEDVELEGDAMPATSHVSRTDVKEDGVGMKIWRRSSPYGTVSEHGLYFVAFACDIHRFDIQLRRMYGLTDDGLSDHLIQFSRAVTGAYWYVPGAAELENLIASGQ